jgi:hypothetical protein
LSGLIRRAAIASTTMLTAVSGAVFVAADAAHAVNNCAVTPVNGAVNIREDKSATAPVAGTLYPGQWLGSSCNTQSGGYYTGCGNGSYWFWVDYGLFSRYVAASCVRLDVEHD